MKLDKLYDLSFPLSEDKETLYFQGQYEKSEDKIVIHLGDVLDLGTYFNSFSITKWIEYTTISKIKVTLRLKGKFLVDFYGMTSVGEIEVLRVKCENSVDRIFNVVDFNDFTLIGIRLTAMSDNAEFLGGSYYGSFETERDIKAGITICTFKREKYLLPNLDRLRILSEQNLNINVMVIDNGQSLKEINTTELQIIHNPNFGGAGGFTRGMMEQVRQGKNSHVILMDDDVIIELSAIERLYSMLRHLKAEHQSKFFAGAMLILDKPTIQHENTACFNKIIRNSFGHNFDLSDKNILCRNESIPSRPNTYAAWWFCCVPIEQIKKIGYPLPIFIKCDDMEYSFRNQQDILTMNGVSVWHEAFENKVNLIMGYYFGNRNTLLMNHFAEGCGRLTFIAAVLGRITKSLLKSNFDGLRMLELALIDLNTGLKGMTATPADEKFDLLKKYPLTKNVVMAIFSIINLTFYHCLDYDKLDTEYKTFRDEQLIDQKFWRHYLNI